MQSNQPYVQIIGAGLVGSLLSLYLEQRGIKTEIYERRSDMRTTPVAGGRSINLAISTRGLTALEKVGLKEKVMNICLPMRGRAVHGLDGSVHFQPYSPQEDCIYSVSRSELNKILMTTAEQKFHVPIHFNHLLTKYNFETQVSHFSTPEENKIKKTLLVFGTDGSSSAVRDNLIKKTSAPFSSEKLTYAYKELIIPADPHGNFQLDPQALHIWPRKNFMLIALPNLDRSFTATLFLPEHGEMGFNQMTTSENLNGFFSTYFSDAHKILPQLSKEFFENPTGQMVTVKLGTWSFEDKALLLGDAAHAIVPFFGQGMNCGFEDCRVLDTIIEKYKAHPTLPWGEIFKEFFQSRKANADAIAELALENFIEMRDKVSDPEFLFLKSVEKILMKNFPQDYISRYQLISFSNTPYSTAQKIGIIEDEILKTLSGHLKNPEDVNLALAAELIQSKLKPNLESMTHGF